MTDYYSKAFKKKVHQFLDSHPDREILEGSPVSGACEHLGKIREIGLQAHFPVSEEACFINRSHKFVRRKLNFLIFVHKWRAKSVFSKSRSQIHRVRKMKNAPFDSHPVSGFLKQLLSAPFWTAREFKMPDIAPEIY